MTRLVLALLYLLATSAALAQSRLEYAVYRVLTQSGQASYQRVTQVKVGERLRLIAHLSTQQDVIDVEVTLPIPPKTRYGGGLTIPEHATATYSQDGRTYVSAASVTTRFVKITVPYAARQTPYAFSFDLHVGDP